ncbi:MAG: hypothetical protein ACI80N_003705 [Gammaproteobacteria bacterium]|jgi:hypothetical protein
MSHRIYVGTRKGLFTVERSDGANASWSITRTDFLGDPVTLVHSEPGGRRVHVALDLGHFGVKTHLSEDSGETWTETEAPKYPEQPEGTVDMDMFKGTPIPWTTKAVWAFAHGTPDQAGRMWCGTIPGGLFRSDNGGRTWQLVRSLWDHPDRKKWFGGGTDFPAIHSILVDPRDGRHVVLGISCGGVWETRDDGETWAQGAQGMRADFLPPEQAMVPDSQDPHLIVACPSAPNSMWTQHHCGIFRTTRGCGHWEEVTDVEPSAFGFAVAVHPDDADTAWFVPAIKDQARYPSNGQVVVTRTRDGGKSFDILRNGLPQEHAYDLVYRHCLDIDGSGERLAFGSTTGALFVTEDQGDSFAQISGHLPPVYCVRFGK